MREALAMGELALKTDETPVGCVFVHEGQIIGRGMNATNRTYNGTRHAEFMAISDILSQPASPPLPPQQQESEPEPELGLELESAAKATSSLLESERNGTDPPSKAEIAPKVTPIKRTKKKYAPEILKQSDLYVTVEPCIMCASLLRQFGIRKVYYGASNEKFGGTGGVLNIHRENGASGSGTGHEEGDYEVSGGWLREEAIVLLRRFYVQENERAPEPRSKKERVLKLEVEPLAEGRRLNSGG
ncbi:cytidine deaminase-like protein [Xylogone sp. PMI_703]|nr:cytidine deaminase-like protein [Xylogone sp. PMI_703]